MIDSYGKAVEERTRRVAAGFGVPDFVYRPVVVRKGSGVREVGDALLWVGRELVVAAMKSRDPDVIETSEREAKWLEKNVGTAIRQVEGTVRTLLSSPKDLLLESERGVSIPWNAAAIEQITGVVVIDHPGAGQYTPEELSQVVPTLVLSSDDWYFLHDRLWSTAAVVKYLGWRARCGLTLPLAAERDVFTAAMIEEADRKDPKIPHLVKVRPGLWEEAKLTRPNDFFGMRDEDRYAQLIDVMIGAVAETDPVYSTVTGPADYLEITEFLDRIPPFHRVTIAKAILKRCEDVGRGERRRTFLTATPSGLLVFVADSSARAERAEYLQALSLARHSQALEVSECENLITLGVATEGLGAGRSHDFVCIRGPIELSTSESRMRDEVFGGLPAEMGSLLDSTLERRQMPFQAPRREV